MEGVSLLHVQPSADQPDWADWSIAFGKRNRGLTHGQKYRNTRMTLDATRNAVGFMLCGVSLIEDDLRDEHLALPFPSKLGLPAACPYRLWTRGQVASRPQFKKFVDWLFEEAGKTQAFINEF